MLSRGGKRTSLPLKHTRLSPLTSEEHRPIEYGCYSPNHHESNRHQLHDTHQGYVQVSQGKPQRRGVSVSRDFSFDETAQNGAPGDHHGVQHQYISCSNSSSSYGYPDHHEHHHHHGYYSDGHQPNYEQQEYSPSQSSSSGPEYLGEEPPLAMEGVHPPPMVVGGDPMSLEETIHMWEMSANAMYANARHSGSVGANGYALAMSSDVYLPEEEVG